MFHIRRYARLISNINKNIQPWPVTTHLIQRPFACFSEQKRQPSEAQMNQIKDNAQQFYSKHIEDIIELQSEEDWQNIVAGSSEPMLIDFYADWCGPCKKLTPKLEQKVQKSGGKIKLLKVNIDKFGRIAQAFQIKAVPTVYMVYGGKAIDAFSGEISDQQLDKFLQTAGRASKIDKAHQEAVRSLEEVKSLLHNHDYEGAEKILSSLKYGNLPEEFKWVADIFLAVSYLEQQKMAQLKSLVEILKQNAVFYQEKPQFKQLFGHLCQLSEKFEQQKQENDDVSNWKKKIDANPEDLSIKFEAAQFYRQNQMIEESLQQLIEIVRQNKAWQDKKANKQILAIFKQLGNSSPITQKNRRLFQQALN